MLPQKRLAKHIQFLILQRQLKIVLLQIVKIFHLRCQMDLMWHIILYSSNFFL